MTQNAIVTRLLDSGMAEVAVLRDTACGGNCASCGGNCASCGGTCSYRNRIFTSAVNNVGAVPGDRVTVKSGTSGVLGRAALVYLLPLVFFFAGYALASLCGAARDLSVIVSVAALLLGAGAVWLINRLFLHGRKMKLEIVSISGRG